MKVLFEKDNFVYDENLILSISNECGIMQDTARLLLHRNIDSIEKAKIFLSPSKKYFYNPNLLFGVKEAVERIKKAKEGNENILVFGDYDADGVCATTVLYSSLNDFGVNVNAVIPEREDGYGLNVEMIKKIISKNKIDVIVTVDCGISDYEKIEEIKKLGLDVIVTDHHEPPEMLPNCICINPKIKGQDYPFNGLCGAGVAYKLSYALIGEKADNYLDFVSLATVADSMDLIDENRNIVYEGLKIFNSNKLRSCFKYCLGENVNKQITAQTLAFSLAPRINAGGRMGDANSALNLFLEEDENEKFNLAVRLNTYNIDRQVQCDEIYNQAKVIIKEKKLYNDKAILIYNESWKSGFVGIVASKLVEEYNRPVIVFVGYDGY
ncbi:MAG: DHH family phosphoesterase [Firmicutes bacterium]|nr:DHH family phosphoesterase [Candidatus Caballimonas caccae]